MLFMCVLFELFVCVGVDCVQPSSKDGCLVECKSDGDARVSVCACSTCGVRMGQSGGGLDV